MPIDSKGIGTYRKKIIGPKANLKGANLKEANLKNANLFRADLSGANLNKMECFGANFEEADLSGANLQDAVCHDANFKNADLRGADLRGTEFASVCLDGADLRGVSLHHARFYNVDLRNLKFDFNGAILPRMLTSSDLGGVSLRGASLELTDASFATFKNADLTGAYLAKSNFWNADLRGADLSGADLSGANLWNADLTGADLTGADLYGANLNGAILTGARITGAIIKGAHNVTRDQLASADGRRVVERAKKDVFSRFLSEIDFKIGVEVKVTPKNQGRIVARLDQLASDVARLAGISKEETPAKTVLSAIEVSNLTPEILELVSDAVLDCIEID